MAGKRVGQRGCRCTCGCSNTTYGAARSCRSCLAGQHKTYQTAFREGYENVMCDGKNVSDRYASEQAEQYAIGVMQDRYGYDRDIEVLKHDGHIDEFDAVASEFERGLLAGAAAAIAEHR